METEKIINEISSLPPEAQRQVEDFVAFLRLRYQKPLKEKPSQIHNIADEAFIGIWKDRKEMKDSGKWVRATRETEWGEPKCPG